MQGIALVRSREQRHIATTLPEFAPGLDAARTSPSPTPTPLVERYLRTGRPQEHSMPDTRTASRPRLIHQRRAHRGSTQPLYYSILCPTCGHRAQLGLTYAEQLGDSHPTVTILQFRCTNQMALTHQSPSDAQLLHLL